MKELPLSNKNDDNNNIMETTADDVITNEEAVRFVNTEGADTEMLGAPRRTQGYKFCGGCCDVRRAIIVVDIIKISIYALLLLILILEFSFRVGQYQSFYRDIHNENGLPDLVVIFPSLALSMVWILTSIAIFSGGIYGAMKCNMLLIGVALMLHSLECGMHLVEFRFIAAIIAALCAYPHIFYVMEVSYYQFIPDPKISTQYSLSPESDARSRRPSLFDPI